MTYGANAARIKLWLSLPDLSDAGLTKLGVDRSAAHRAGGLAWSRIATVGRVFDLTDHGPTAVVMPVWRGPAPSLDCSMETPYLADLIAWRPCDPGRWWYRWGADSPTLGDEYVIAAHTHGRALNCQLTPLEWLRGGCRGTVLLDIAEDFAPTVVRTATGEPPPQVAA